MTDLKQALEGINLHTQLTIDSELGLLLNNTRIRLLEAIDTHGSLNAAAKSLPLSYKAAWDALDHMNNLALEPVVLRSTGGAKGGGTQLTGYGRQLIGLYRCLELEQKRNLDSFQQWMRHQQDAEHELHDYRQLLRRMNLSSSARNQFFGKIEVQAHGVVNAQVTLSLDGALNLVATITEQSLANMGLAAGDHMLAMVKASQVVLFGGEVTSCSLQNLYQGRIVRIEHGSVHSEVNVDIGGHKTLCASVTRSSAEQMGLAEGMQVSAGFSAANVILCGES
ncbi:TOBE domain-containing protein [Vibrio sp. WXL103]|uniref:TOBE domain-containing protein n=1 Tax=Vibrio sp. WXL103 TaxID=3450710 RepID=UPI003EC80C8F